MSKNLSLNRPNAATEAWRATSVETVACPPNMVRRQRQDLTACVQEIRRDQAAHWRNQAYLVILALLLVAALETAAYVYLVPSLAALFRVTLLLTAALITAVLMAWPK